MWSAHRHSGLCLYQLHVALENEFMAVGWESSVYRLQDLGMRHRTCRRRRHESCAKRLGVLAHTSSSARTSDRTSHFVEGIRNIDVCQCILWSNHTVVVLVPRRSCCHVSSSGYLGLRTPLHLIGCGGRLLIEQGGDCCQGARGGGGDVCGLRNVGRGCLGPFRGGGMRAASGATRAHNLC